MTPDSNLPKAIPPTPVKNPLSDPGDRSPTPLSRPSTNVAPDSRPAARPPMVPVPKPILPVAVPAPAKPTKGDGSDCDSSASPAKNPSNAPGSGPSMDEACCSTNKMDTNRNGKSRGGSGESCDSSNQGR